ncbi:MAG: hypothetical protein Q9167_006071 [Letrouitia subvulpina]
MVPFSDDYTLNIRQEPARAKVTGQKEKVDRKPVDPPPIVQLQIRDPTDPTQNYLQSPYFFMCCNLCDTDGDQPNQLNSQSALAGTLVSSLHRLKDVDNSDAGFFVFGDLSVKVEGEYRLRFSLFEMLKTEVVYIKSITSNVFTGKTAHVGAPENHIDEFLVFGPKAFPGMTESTFLSRSFGDQGVRLRIRKEPRTLLKRHASSGLRDDYPPSFDQQSPSRQRSTTLQPASTNDYGSRFAGYSEPSYKRQRTSVDMGYDPERVAQRSILDQRGSLSSFPLRDQQSSNYSSSFAQGPQSAISAGSDYSYSHQRTNSSNISSPFVSPHTDFPGPSWPASTTFFQPSLREPLLSYPPQQYQEAQVSRHQLTEPVPRYREQGFYGRNSANNLIAFSRAPDPDISLNSNFNTTRPVAFSSSFQDSTLRLPPTEPVPDALSSSRPQYSASPHSNILPPLESTVSGNQARGGAQSIIGSNVVQSIETPTLVPSTTSQPGPDRGQDEYDTTGLNYIPNRRIESG